MRMVLVVVVEPSGTLVKRSFGVGHGADAQVVALQRLYKGLAHTVALGARHRREAGHEVKLLSENVGVGAAWTAKWCGARPASRPALRALRCQRPVPLRHLRSNPKGCSSKPENFPQGNLQTPPHSIPLHSLSSDEHEVVALYVSDRLLLDNNEIIVAEGDKHVRALL